MAILKGDWFNRDALLNKVFSHSASKTITNAKKIRLLGLREHHRYIHSTLDIPMRYRMIPLHYELLCYATNISVKQSFFSFCKQNNNKCKKKNQTAEFERASPLNPFHFRHPSLTHALQNDSPPLWAAMLRY